MATVTAATSPTVSKLNLSSAFIRSVEFKKRLNEILKHDRQLFDEPHGWQKKPLADSPLVSDFEDMWKQLKNKYKSELTALAFAPIPDENKIEKVFKTLIKKCK